MRWGEVGRKHASALNMAKANESQAAEAKYKSDPSPTQVEALRQKTMSMWEHQKASLEIPRKPTEAG